MKRELTILAFLTLAALLAAQDRPPARPDRRPDGPGGRPGLGRLLDLTEEQRSALRQLRGPDRERAILRLMEARQAADEKAFIETLTDEERASLEALAGQPEKRREKLITLRVERRFARVAEEARNRGAVADEEIDRISRLTLRDKAEATLGLQKQLFVVTHGQDWSEMPERLRAELQALPAREFFEHPALRDYRTFAFLTPSEIQRLRSVDPDLLEAFTADLERGRVSSEVAEAVFSPQRRAALVELPSDVMKRLARDMRRIHFARELRGARGQEPSDFPLPPSLFDELSREEQRTFQELPARLRLPFSLRRFGAERLEEAGRADFLRMMPRPVRERFLALPEDVRAKILQGPPPEMQRRLHDALPELGPKRGGRRDPPPRQGPPPGPDGGRPGPPGPDRRRGGGRPLGDPQTESRPGPMPRRPS